MWQEYYEIPHKIISVTVNYRSVTVNNRSMTVNNRSMTVKYFLKAVREQEQVMGK